MALTVSGPATITGDLDVDGLTEIDALNVAETATFSGNIDANGNLDVAGTSTFAGNLNLSDDTILYLGSDNDTSIVHSGTNTIMNVDGNFSSKEILSTSKIRQEIKII